MDEVQKALQERYSHLHPLIFFRSLEKAATNVELFDILEDYPKEYPVIWDNTRRRWRLTKNILQASNPRKE